MKISFLEFFSQYGPSLHCTLIEKKIDEVQNEITKEID